MDQITDLRELLKHELKDLYSAETQIIDGLPKMIEKAKSPQLKKAFSDHLKVTRDQRKRLEKIQDILEIVNETKEEGGGFFANLFKSKEGEQHCKAMEGLIKEGESIMSEDMEPDVMDAALIAAAQKIEHYEIGSYGTARAYAEQMGMKEVESLLRETLDEEYFADDSLTKIALERVNIKAENAGGALTAETDNSNGKSNGQPAAFKKTTGRKSVVTKSAAKKSAPKKTAAKKSAAKKSATGKVAAKKAAPKKAPKKVAAKKAAPKKAAAKKVAAKKVAAKKAAAKKVAPKKAAPKRSTGNRAMAKRAAPKKSASKKSAVKKSAPKKAVAKRSAAKKSAPKKAIARKSTRTQVKAKKSAPKKSPAKSAAKKTATKKTATKKTATKKSGVKKSGVKKSAPKKAAAKKSGRRR